MEQINLSDHFTNKRLIQFTLPTIIMMIFTSIYGVVDGLFISNVVGSNAFASVNLVLPATMIMGTIGFMFGTGGSAIISITLGTGQRDLANQYFSMFVYLETIISQFVGAGIPLVYFIRQNTSTLRLGRPAHDGAAILKACTNGSSEMVTNLSMSLISILFNLQLMRFAGADGVAAYGVIMYVGFIFVGTYMGYSVGSAPIVSYHYGAGNKAEVQGLLRRSLRLLAAAAVILSALAEILAYPLSAIFVGYDAELCTLTAHALRLYAISYVISWFNIYASSFFTALNDGLVSALISFLRTFLFQVIAVLLLPALWGIDGIWLSVAAAEAAALIVSMVCYIVNRKKYGY